MLKPITWTGHSVRLLDQTRLPRETVYLEITDEKQMHDAIRRLVVRGAPAIGVAAAFGAYLGIKDVSESDPQAFRIRKRLDDVCNYLATSRPTAVNLFWALDRIRAIGHRADQGDIRMVVLTECQKMIEEDNRVCRAIGEHGLGLLQSQIASVEPAQRDNRKSQITNILTHCNAGGLATAGYGTALAPIYFGIEQGKKFHVYADETRPLLQGSRIT